LLLTSMPGVGLVLACTLMALLPELGTMSRKQVAALVGVAPEVTRANQMTANVTFRCCEEQRPLAHGNFGGLHSRGFRFPKH
jgi:hypothetical protein